MMWLDNSIPINCWKANSFMNWKKFYWISYILKKRDRRFSVSKKLYPNPTYHLIFMISNRRIIVKYFYPSSWSSFEMFHYIRIRKLIWRLSSMKSQLQLLNTLANFKKKEKWSKWLNLNYQTIMELSYFMCLLEFSLNGSYYWKKLSNCSGNDK
jgi:hypothetical protein